MNERLEYRAWVVNRKVMRDVFSYDCNHVYLWNRDGEEYIVPPNNDPDECILMQCTGLKDKNGIEKIFENDIINLFGEKVGNIYENEEILKDGTNFVVAGICTSTWRYTEQEAIKRGCRYAE